MTDARSKSEKIVGAVGGLDQKLPEAPKKSVATLLVELAEKHFEFGVSLDDKPFGIPKTGPAVVRMLRGGQSLRAELARRYWNDKGKAASGGALSDALQVIEGKALTTKPKELFLRVATGKLGGGAPTLLLDLGDETGRCVQMTSVDWKVLDKPPVLFRRTAATGALPEPVRGSSFEPLWDCLNIQEQYRPLALAWLVSVLFSDIPHPVPLITGEQGTGKSSACARLSSLVDPSPAQLRKKPKDEEEWTVQASGSWVCAMDNLSGISDWLSDAICRAVTGDGSVRRKLYADDDLSIFNYRRCVMVNGIDVGALRGDFADRALHLPLAPIADADRMKDKELAAHWKANHPKILGALCDLTVQVLAVLPTIELEAPPRMADFAYVLAAVDQIRGTDGLKVYRGLRDELAEEAAASDPVLASLALYITTEFKGSAADLLDKLHAPPGLIEWASQREGRREWPRNARALTAALTRNAPTLRQLGWTVDNLGREGDPRGKSIFWQLVPPPPEEAPSTAEEITLSDLLEAS